MDIEDGFFNTFFKGPLTDAQTTIITELKRERTRILQINEQQAEKIKRLTDRAIDLADNNNNLRQENKRLTDEISNAKAQLEDWAEGRPWDLSVRSG